MECFVEGWHFIHACKETNRSNSHFNQIRRVEIDVEYKKLKQMIMSVIDLCVK